MRAIWIITASVAALVFLMPAFVDRQAVDSWAESTTTESLVEALADDDVRWNALVAQMELSKRGDEAAPALERALRSSDWQQRQFAASLLRRIESYEPSDVMIFVCVEGLANDRLPYDRDRRRRSYVSNATDGTLYLIRHIDRAEGIVAAGLHFNDAQQRFFCAYILGMTSCSAYAPRICGILTSHLNDNTISGDAVLATRALYLTGPRVIPYLNEASEHADAQGRSLIKLVIEDLNDPPGSLKELYARGEMSDITILVHDPAYQDVSIRSVFPFRGTYVQD